MKLLGLKPKRVREWLADIKVERPGLSEFYLMGKLMAKAILSGRSREIARKNYFQRLLICHHCPVFDRKLKRCRNGAQGCGCYVPFKALAPVDGWKREMGLNGCWGVAEYKG